MKLPRPSTLHIALAVSVLLHALLLTVRFVDPEGLNRVLQDTLLEVILVNAHSELPPEQAQALAQANLAGGGEAQQGRATSPLPPAAQAQLGDALQDEQRRMAAMQAQQDRLLAQLRDDLAQLAHPPDPATPGAEALQREQRRQALVKMLAEIEKRINEENARPRKRYISPATREVVYALYYDELRRKIEAHGTAQFPQYAGNKLYGELTMVITIQHNGQVLNTEVVQGSGIPMLDQRAQALVRDLTFGRFNAEMRRRADQLVVVSRFRFTRDEVLHTQMGGR